MEALAKQLKATLCYDAVGGDLTGRILKALPKGSSVEVYGAMSECLNLNNIGVSDILFGCKTVKGFWLTEELEGMGMIKKLNLMRKLQSHLKKELKSVISRQSPLANFHSALEFYLKNMSQGKVIIKPWDG